MPQTAWAGGCRSWYKGNDADVDAPVLGVHPGTRLHFIKMLQQFRGEDWEYVYIGENEGSLKPNRFTYLGNGFTTEEDESLNAIMMV